MQPDLLGLRADESAAYRALIAIPSATWERRYTPSSGGSGS